MNLLTPLLQGKRVRLEPMTPDHLPALAEIAFDSRIWQYMVFWVRTRADLEQWMETAFHNQARSTDLPWVTVLLSGKGKEHDRVVGSTRLTRIKMAHQTAEIGHSWLTPQVQGSGINTEAKFLQLQYAFESLGLARVAFRTHHQNLQSQAAIRKLGAQYEGTARNHYRMPDGTRRHTQWFSITQEDWPQVRSKLERRLALGEVASQQEDR